MKKILIISCVLLFAATSCHRGESPIVDGDSIKVSATISAGQTRTPIYDATDGTGQFAASDVIGVYVIRHNGQFAKNMSNVSHRVDGAGNNSYFWEDMQAPSVTFASYYPYVEQVADPYNYEFSLIHSDDLYKKDLLLALSEPLVYPASAVELTFHHVMHKLVVNLTHDSSYSDAEINSSEVTLYGMKPTSVVDIVAAQVKDVKGSAADIVDTRSASSREFLLAPQSVTTGAPMLKIAIANSAIEGATVNYFFNVPATLSDGKPLADLQSGKVLTLTLSVTKGGISLSSGEILPWGDQGDVEDKPVIDFN